MDNEIIYAIGGIVVFIIIIFFTLRGDVPQIIQTKEEKRADILSSYKEELQKTLKAFDFDDKTRLIKKTFLLKKFNDELSRNIFFDNDEIREIIQELSEEN